MSPVLESNGQVVSVTWPCCCETETSSPGISPFSGYICKGPIYPFFSEISWSLEFSFCRALIHVFGSIQSQLPFITWHFKKCFNSIVMFLLIFTLWSQVHQVLKKYTSFDVVQKLSIILVTCLFFIQFRYLHIPLLAGCHWGNFWGREPSILFSILSINLESFLKFL